jgi:hypothetical protein
MRHLSSRRLLVVLVAVLGAVPVAAQQSILPQDATGFRLFGELKVHYRNSDFVEFRIPVDFPPDFFEPGDNGVFLRTPEPGGHWETSVAKVGLAARFSPSVDALALIWVEDLYNRNPTSLDDRVFVREAWFRFGTPDGHLQPLEAGSWFLQVGKSPRFAKQEIRHLESYGLWGTAVNRFEIWQAKLGVTLVDGLYVRAQYGIAGPLFMRDVNALAGDNGTPERKPGNVHPKYGSGLPILYDARPPNFEFNGPDEWGAGLGWRWADASSGNGLDVLAWHFSRTLEDAPEIEGSFYQGDLELLRGAGLPLPFEGDSKHETGLNVTWRFGNWFGFGQYVDQDIAGLGRSGAEIVTGWNIPLPGLFAAFDRPVVNWIRPTVRYSFIDNDFAVPPPFITPSLFWDWTKLDAGVRIGIVRDVDITAEWSRNDVELANGSKIHPDEFLATLRIGW